MWVYSGYWRRSTNSSTIVECLNPDACLGGYEKEKEHPVNCEEGYTGNLCTKCLITEDAKYQEVNGFE